MIGFAQFLVYTGAVAILVVFAILLTRRAGKSEYRDFSGITATPDISAELSVYDIKERNDAQDQRLRRNIQWGIVRGMFMYSLLMLPVVLILSIIIASSR